MARESVRPHLAALVLLSALWARPASHAAESAPGREAFLANPLLSGQPILFVTRSQYRNEHGTEATMYQTGQVNTHCFQGGGALRLLDVGTGKVTTLLEVPAGIVRDPEVHFDGKKILFSMRRDIRDDYHLYEMNAQGGNLRQLTFAPGVSDIQPIYLPDDTIVFSSTRDPKYIPCQRHLMANLFRMNADGSNIRQIGYNMQFEGRASLMPVAAGPYVPDAFTDTRDDCDLSRDAHDPSMKHTDLSLKPEAYFSHGLSKQQRGQRENAARQPRRMTDPAGRDDRAQ